MKKKATKVVGKPAGFDKVVCNLRGQPLTIGDETLTVKFAIVTALLNTFSDEREIDGAEKARRYQLAQAIDAGKSNLSGPDRRLIKTLVGKTFGPPVVGPVFETLNETAALEEPEILVAPAASLAIDEEHA